MRNPEINAHIHRGFRVKAYNLYVSEYNPGTMEYREFTKEGPVEVQAFVEGPGPLASLTEQEAQILMDSMWSAGLRPTESAPTEGCLQKMQDHIDTLKAQLGRTMGQTDFARFVHKTTLAGLEVSDAQDH